MESEKVNVDPEKELLVDKHVDFIRKLDQQKESLEYWHSEHLRLSGVYWGVTALALMGRLEDTFSREEVLAYVVSCYHPEVGGFGGHPGHDAHLLYTLSALQILAIYATSDGSSEKPTLAVGPIDLEKVADFIAGLQDPKTGAFFGDEWGETDTRFTYAALNALALLGRLTRIDLCAASQSLLETQNPDGGFGAHPGSESHAGQIFTCVAGLAILGQLDIMDSEIHSTRDRLAWWLCERQLECGGLNGRPEKKEDVCYSWWVLSALQTLGRVNWINKDKLVAFILKCQDPAGGFSDRPGNVGDVFHTLFGLTGLSLLGDPRLKPVDPVFCLPQYTVQRLGLDWAASHYALHPEVEPPSIAKMALE
ncbi:Rab geranylgeranyltransferase [Entomophthora muscae]|uniref:Rab geranylgeranyltransferase n=2 Tax=Entomophthora muscae TaxID=34485 RepID=A0ACC2SMQ3_9FUNG|nr:Rab geranylgeranyltransferase [Entomophthora muscae]